MEEELKTHLQENSTGDFMERLSNASNSTNISGFVGLEIISSEDTTMNLLIMKLVFYFLIIFIGFIGNSLICIAVLSKKKCKISEYFILNLAITDLAVSTISIPMDIAELLSNKWPFGAVMCKIIWPLQTVLMAVSVVTLLIMSLERHRAIMSPLKPKLQSNKAICVIFIIWIFCILLVSPYIYILKYAKDECLENWSEPHYYKVYTMSVFLALYLFPLGIITVAYIRISMKLLRDIDSMTDVICGTNTSMMKKRAKRNARIVKIFVLAVLAFATCMLPNHVVWIWHDFGSGWEPYFDNIVIFCNILVYANSTMNPFIFGTLNSKYDFRTCCRAITFKPFRREIATYRLRLSFTSSSRIRNVLSLKRKDSECIKDLYKLRQFQLQSAGTSYRYSMQSQFAERLVADPKSKQTSTLLMIETNV